MSVRGRSNKEGNILPQDDQFREKLFNTSSKSKMILMRLGGGDEAYYAYVEEADNDVNKNSALI